MAAALPLLLLLGACDPAEDRFTVRGTITDPLATEPGSVVYMTGPDGPIDSVLVSDSHFSFSGSIDKTKLLTVYLSYPERNEWDKSFTAVFVPDSEVIGIDLDYPVTVTGSPLTDAVNDYQEQLLKLYYEPELDMEDLDLDEEQLDSLVRVVQLPKILDLSRQTYLSNTDNALGMQAFFLLVTELEREELETLLDQGDDFIKKNEKIKELIENK